MTNEINFVDWSTFSEKDFEHIKETTGRYYGKNSFKAGAVEFDIWGPSDYEVSGNKIFVDCRIRQPDKDTVSSEASVIYDMPGSIPEAQLDSMSYESFQKGINLFLCNELAGEHANEYAVAIDGDSAEKSAAKYMTWRKNHEHLLEGIEKSDFLSFEIEEKYADLFVKENNYLKNPEMEDMKMANETTKTNEMTAEATALREEIASTMAAKAAEGKAVWQTPKDERPIMHTPVNPRTGNYFQNGTALLLMQAQFEKKTADNRWISTKSLNTLKEKEGKDIRIKKGETAISIASGGKPVKYFNYSQLQGKDVPNSIEIIDKNKDSLGESMLNYMDFKATKAKEKSEVTKENFWDLGKKAQYSATCFVSRMQNDIDKAMSVYKDAMPEFENRLAAIKGFDRNTKPRNNEEQFMLNMSWNLARYPEKNSYVVKAAASALIKQVPEKEVIRMIDKFAPEAAKDSVKQGQGKEKYSAFVMGVLSKDKGLEKKIAEGKNKSAAR